jgi:N-acetyl-gamma-glutamyl-phosphate reductase
MRMGMTAAVVGASGYAGGELLRLLTTHPDLDVGAVAAASNAGRPLTQLHPQLRSLSDLVLCGPDDPAIAAADVVFLALPHGESARVATTLPGSALVVDLGADFRLARAEDWTRFYGGAHAGTWPYGLPELPGCREQIAAARRIANPGCYATAITLALAPLLTAAVVEPGDVVVTAASGTSGAGRTAKPHLLGTEVMGDLSPYKVGGTHQHLAELRQSLTAAAEAEVTMSFTPVLAPMPRGILAMCSAPLSAGIDTAALRSVLRAAYDDEPFVHVLGADEWPHTAATLGSNSCHLQVVADIDAGRAVVIAAIDNLGKGAAGQAIQNANIALGLPETTGLPVDGVAP